MSLPAPSAPADAADPPLIELDRASVVRGQVRVLHELSLRIAPGQHTALLGANGSGKSTLIKLLTRELYPLARADGSAPVRLLGQARWQVDRLRSQLGIVTGDFGATLAGLPELSAEDAVLGGLFASFVVPPFQHIDDSSPGMRSESRMAAQTFDTICASSSSSAMSIPSQSSGSSRWSYMVSRRVSSSSVSSSTSMRSISRTAMMRGLRPSRSNWFFTLRSDPPISVSMRLDTVSKLSRMASASRRRTGARPYH